MTQMHITLRTAPAAIAAVLAISGLTAHAQDAAPTIILPDVSAIPEVPAPEPASSPVVQSVPVSPEPAEAAPVAAVPAPAAERSGVAARTPAAPVPVAAAPVAAVVDPVPPAPVPVETVDPIQPVAALPADAAAVAAEDDGVIAPLLGTAAAIGLGLLGLAALRRRKSREAAEAVPVIVKPRLADPAPLADPAIAAVTEVPHATVSDIRPPARMEQPHGILPNSGAAVALPQVAPTDYEERTALLRRMVNARPDRANPFVHRKARMRRARLILQSLGHDFADRDPLIDLSDYPQNWPLVARRKYATAA